MRYLRVYIPHTRYRTRGHARQPRGSPPWGNHAPIEISEPRVCRQETALERLMGCKGKRGPTRSGIRNFRPRHARTRTCPPQQPDSEPRGNGAVTVTLPETTGCDAAGAICTHDQRKLSHATSVPVAGPQQAASSRFTPTRGHRTPAGLAGHSEQTRNARETTMSCTTYRVAAPERSAAHTLCQSQ